MIRIAICDDDELFTSEVERMLDELCVDLAVDTEISIFFSGHSLVKYYQDNAFDLICLDIDMDQGNGIDAAKDIRKLDSAVSIIYISSYDNYIMELFDVQPTGFLDKPINTNKFNTTFSAVLKKICRSREYFEYTYKRNVYKVPINKIKYFVSSGRKIIISTTLNDEFEFYMKLDDLEDQLRKKNIKFIRTHHSYLVNFYFIRRFGYASLELMDDEVLHISPKKQKQVRNEYMQLLGKTQDLY